MAGYTSQPLRALSPITELTTPTSLRTLTLPYDDIDYASERETHRYSGDSSNVINDHDDETRSLHSNHSGETVKQDRPSTEEQRTNPASLLASPRDRTASLPSPDPPPHPRSLRRPIPLLLTNHSSMSLGPPIGSPRAIPFPLSAPLPGGLHPPPRALSAARQASLRRPTPPPSPLHHRHTTGQSPSYEEQDTASEPLSPKHSGMAGVGAGGRTESTGLRNRPKSFHASPAEPGSRRGSPTKYSTNVCIHFA